MLGVKSGETKHEPAKRDMFHSSRKELSQHMQNAIYQGMSLEIQCSRYVLGIVSKHFLPSMHQNSRFLEGKQVFSINYNTEHHTQT